MSRQEKNIREREQHREEREREREREREAKWIFIKKNYFFIYLIHRSQCDWICGLHLSSTSKHLTEF
ncbi:MAG: hypothetical protein J8272_00520, partial ['Prunus persica' phytoplasma PP2]|nr:hypothetical protein ['Prunus persica' phytoplasma PP2]